ncbi:hypothetical protein QBC36DRAFT_371626 [Triangularia setosa]|uniref:Uncharacterized protein n=1 Tax=Triangularia setosa TaxID=2587417 RepID=A0AAN6WAG1_9PEZI|nr:hypothetical protein QBC36DRAFT_371626 [Podospora setosa]
MTTPAPRAMMMTMRMGQLVASYTLGKRHTLSKRAGVYVPAFRIPVGKYFCPSEENGDNEGTDCKTIQPDWDNDKYLTDQDDYVEKKKKRQVLPTTKDVGFGPFNSTAQDHILAQANIVSTRRWHNNVSRGVTEALRNLVGSVNYHNNFTVRSHINAQKGRVGNIFDAIKTALPSHRRVVNNIQYGAWQRQDLRRRWNEFMNSKLYLVQAKMKVINDFLPALQVVWADDGARSAAEDQLGDSGNTLADKQRKRDLIDDIDALADRMRMLSAWVNPFG